MLRLWLLLIEIKNLLTFVPVHDVITCCMAQGVTRTINVNEIAAADLDVVSQTLCSSMIC